MLWPGEFSALGGDNCRDSVPFLGDQVCAGNAAFLLADPCLTNVLNGQMTFAVGSLHGSNLCPELCPRLDEGRPDGLGTTVLPKPRSPY